MRRHTRCALVTGVQTCALPIFVEGIRKTGKPVEGFALERNGEIKTVADASRVAQKYVQDASEIMREECPISDLWVSVKCGESDTTSGLGSNPTVGNLIDKLDPLGITSCFGERSEEHTSELQSLMRISYAVFCLKQKKRQN